MAKKEEAKAREITINGYVEEVELEDGNSGIMINDGDDDYHLVMDKSGKKLLDHIDEEVEVTGMLSKKHGELMLKVTRFRLVDDYEDQDEDEEFDDHWDD
jgi:aspartyl/asparaginyl-tRNA synthetase